MPKPNANSPLVLAAAAVDEELCEYEELAREAKRVELDSEKALTRAAGVLEEATNRQPRIQEKLQALVGEIQAAQSRQQTSLSTLIEASRDLARRAEEFETLMNRVVALGESAGEINQLTVELSARRKDGAADGEMLDGLRSLEERMNAVEVDAEALARDAEKSLWPEIARQVEALRQQVFAAKNRLVLAHRTVSERAP
jgi:hypothetical protein